ncbi:MAG: nucleoside deaminase [Salinivirgaceae bacterium]|nr:nucleoside deaminase [Salinivirgaceae bacterium]
MENNDRKFMLDAIQLSMDNLKQGGGPFGAVIVKDGKIVAAAANSVTNDNDPTAHAEVNCIRKACAALKTFDLAGCTIYTSCEPCPMCLGAIYWAHIDKVFYGNNKVDARNIGFDDSFIYDEIDLPIDKRKVEFIQLLPEEAIKTFQTWIEMDGKTEY